MRTSLRDALAMTAAVLAPFLTASALLPLRTSRARRPEGSGPALTF
ncbi:hypothetical protein [Streptomyces sp. NPDC053431]